MTLSVVTAVNEPLTREFYLKELLISAIPIADEIVIISGEQGGHTSYGNQEIAQILDELSKEGYDLTKINMFFNPWEVRMKKNMYWMQKSVAISHATCDYVLRLDADEVIHEKDYDKIKQCLELGHDAYTFKTLHFYKDFNTLKGGKNKVDDNNPWYERRPYLFKNGLGIYENQQDLVDVNGNYLDCKHTSVEIFHVGHVRGKKAYIDKKNAIEKSYHEDWEDITEFEWDKEGLSKFEGIHPKAMEERVGIN